MGDVPVATQGEVFLVTCTMGLLIGASFDFYRTCRFFKKPSRKGTFMLDLLFSLAVTVMVYLGLLFTNWGEVRFYVFIGIITGLILYYLLLSRLLLAIYGRLIKYLIILATAYYRVFSFFLSTIKLLIRPLALFLKATVRIKRIILGKAGRLCCQLQSMFNYFHKKKF